ncbi:MAG TPA: glycosyltransferase, partial [Thermomicrobiaceae bacterium]|nr:glycosyltransferase [Thermomicrobiaceae bacterium]
MRVLFCAQPGTGHWRPLAPFARALQTAEPEHEVAFAVTPASAREIERHGFHCFPTGIDDWLPEYEAQQQAIETATLSGQTSAGAPKPETVESVWLNTFLPRAKRNLPELLEICRAWQPNLIVREQTEFGGWLAAELLGLPHVAVQVSAYRPRINQLIAPALDRLRAELGLSAEPALNRLYPYLLVLPFPPSLIPAGADVPATAHFIQSTSYDLMAGTAGDDTASLDWLAAMPDQPNVYVTFGTAYNKDPDRFRAVIEALGSGPVNLILTTNDIDPDRFAGIVARQPHPGSIRIERYLAQSQLLPHCDLVLSHGGFGTVRAAVARGLPQVIMPIAADQPDNAQRCAELGIAVNLGPNQRKVPDIRDAVMTVLGTPSYHERAAALRDEFLALPDIAASVALF